MKDIRADLIGLRFGRLIIDSFHHIQNQKAHWLAKCDCGNIVTIPTGHLKNGHTKSCGCLNLELHTKHGHAIRNLKDSTYMSWQAMGQRCTNPNNVAFLDYGNRGINVCERWSKFENFLEDMGFRPEGKTLDRIDNSKGYFKKNCRWATPAEQIKNRRNSSKSENREEHIKWKRRLFQILHNSINTFNKFGNSNSPLFAEYIGCSFKDFRKYIENQFVDNMNWDNYGQDPDKWNLEHIFPINNFDLSKEEDRYKCFHYSNFQPMWTPDNLAKIKKDNKLYVTA